MCSEYQFDLATNMNRTKWIVVSVYLLVFCIGYGIGHWSDALKCEDCLCFKSNETLQLVANCTERNLTDVPQTLLSDIQILWLNRNKIKIVENWSFWNYTSLIILDLSDNNIIDIQEHAFDGLQNLEVLKLDNCFLSYRENFLNFSLFKPLKQLIELSMRTQRNESFVTENYPMALRDLPSLETLFIDGLQNANFDEEFRALKKLKSLTLSGHTGFCNIGHLQDSTFNNVPHIEILNVSKCNLYRVHCNTLKPLQNLTILDLSQNSCLEVKGIEEATYGLRNSNSIKALYLNEVVHPYATCVTIGDTLFENLQNTTINEVHLDGNRIEKFTCNAFLKYPGSLKKVSLKQNRFTYGMYLLAVKYLFGLTELDLGGEQHYRFIEGSSVLMFCPTVHHSNCSRPTYESYVNDSKYLVSTSIPLPPNLTKLSFKYRHLPYIINEISFQNNSLNYADLSYNLFTQWHGPVHGFEDLEYLDLSHNSAKNVSPGFFNTFPSLRKLSVSSNTLKYALESDTSGEIFDGLHNLTHLDLSNNIINRLPADVFSSLSSLHVLNLSYNNLREFNSNIHHMKELQIIDCSYNEIRWIRRRIRDQLDQLANITLYLAENTFDCTCENYLFLSWLQNSKVQFGNEQNYKCMYSTGDDSPRVYLHEILEDLEIDCHNHFSIYIVTICAMLVVLFGIVFSIGYRFRWKLRYWYYAARLRYRAVQSNDPSNFEYDAFISFADEDREFVISELIEKLETESGLRLNIHQRDFTVGRPIATNIIEAVKNSRKTLLILTEHFIQSYWCHYELQMANMESVTTGRDVIIVLRLGHVRTKDIPTEILYHFQTNSYIEYPKEGDTDLFWTTLAGSIKC